MKLNLLRFVFLSCLSMLTLTAQAQKIDKEFRSFYKGLQRNIETDRVEAITNIVHFPLQTIYWVDELNNLSEEEKRDGLLESEDFDRYRSVIFNEDVKRIIPLRQVEQVQQIDIESSGDYYKRLAELIDPGSTLLELYCQYGEYDTVGDNYFAFVFGKVNGEYRILAYYTDTRVKE